MPRFTPNRRALTLIELLICLAIIGLAISLLSGAVQSSREAARKVQCKNHQRQLGIGIQLHMSKLRMIPSNGGYDGKSTVTASDGQQARVGTYLFSSDRQFWWGVGTPGARPRQQTGSWGYAILPFIEQGDAYDQVRVESAGPLFTCPSRSRPLPLVPTEDDFGRYAAAGRVWARTDYAGNEHVVRNRPKAMPPSEVIDGMSQTLVLGEKAFNPVIQTAGSWYYDESLFTGGSDGTVRGGLLIDRDGPKSRVKGHWGSPHPGGAVFTRLDGSIEFIDANIDGQLFRKLQVPNDGGSERIY
jgi:prepilin-type N-terminal cleavage/methylation domain-containing protein